mmetsp:Transcript_24168/g.56144  ORF Transcript_24168/g.56144 Transcript_24168/m.56144 type:complete len:237 (+) Transcript_24168:1672-2382(+)
MRGCAAARRRHHCARKRRRQPAVGLLARCACSSRPRQRARRAAASQRRQHSLQRRRREALGRGGLHQLRARDVAFAHLVTLRARCRLVQAVRSERTGGWARAHRAGDALDGARVRRVRGVPLRRRVARACRPRLRVGCARRPARRAEGRSSRSDGAFGACGQAYRRHLASGGCAAGTGLRAASCGAHRDGTGDRGRRWRASPRLPLLLHNARHLREGRGVRVLRRLLPRVLRQRRH